VAWLAWCPAEIGTWHDRHGVDRTRKTPWACEAIEVLVSDYDASGGPRLRVTLARMPRRSTWHISTSIYKYVFDVW
jgi:hypothetical protein